MQALSCLELQKQASKTIAGHRGRRRVGIQYVCECGWGSSVWYGKGATGGAAAEFLSHKERHLRAQMDTKESAS